MLANELIMPLDATLLHPAPWVVRWLRAAPGETAGLPRRVLAWEIVISSALETPALGTAGL